MKRFFTTMCLVWALSATLQAQDTTLAFLAPTLDTIQVEASTFEETLYFNLINLTSDTLNLQATRIGNNLQPGQGSYFCWDLCYDSLGDQSQSPISLAPGDTTSFGQYLVFKPNGLGGFSSVTMVFADVNGFAISRTFEYEVETVTSVISFDPAQGYLSNPYPNPTQGQATLQYRLPLGVGQAELQVIDLLGREVAQVPLTQPRGTAHIDLSQTQRGIYFLRLVTAEKALISRRINLN
jgi:hypothetical protein